MPHFHPDYADAKTSEINEENTLLIPMELTSILYRK